MLSNFRQIWYVQVLHRQNEAIGLDYVIPWRVITPAARQGAAGEGADPLMMMSGGDFRAQARRMVRERRRDPASVQVFPFPVNFQMFGADAKNLAPTDLIQQGYERLLNDLGTPVEMFNASMELNAAAPAMRLFESSHRPLVHGACRFVAWIANACAAILNWESVDATLKRVTIADDLQKQMMAAQLLMSQQLSGTTVLGELGLQVAAGAEADRGGGEVPGRGAVEEPGGDGPGGVRDAGRQGGTTRARPRAEAEVLPQEIFCRRAGTALRIPISGSGKPSQFQGQPLK